MSRKYPIEAMEALWMFALAGVHVATVVADGRLQAMFPRMQNSLGNFPSSHDISAGFLAWRKNNLSLEQNEDIDEALKPSKKALALEGGKRAALHPNSVSQAAAISKTVTSLHKTGQTKGLRGDAVLALAHDKLNASKTNLDDKKKARNARKNQKQREARASAAAERGGKRRPRGTVKSRNRTQTAGGREGRDSDSEEDPLR